MPVHAHGLPGDQVDRTPAATVRGDERPERHKARKDVQAGESGEREEGRARAGAAGADALGQKPRVLAALTGEEYGAKDNRGREPAATFSPRREGHRAAASEKRDGEDGRPADIQRRLRRSEPRVAVRDVSEHDREEEDRLRGDEDGDAEERAVCPDRRSHRDHGASRSSGCLRSQSGRRPVTAGMLEKFSGGGGEVVAHSRVNASHGSSPAISPERRLRTRLTKKMTIAIARIAAPIVDRRFNGPQPVLAAYVNTRRGIPTAPSQCCGRNVRLNPTKVIQKCHRPRTSSRSRPVILGNQ